MESKLDELLKYALAPTEDAEYWLNQKILSRVEEKQNMKRKQKYFRSIPAAVLAAVLAVGVTSMTAFAAWKYLSAQEVTEKTGDVTLAEAFWGEGAISINESQSFGGYRVTLMGMVSGENLSSYYHFDGAGNSFLTDRTYVVVSIENGDGTPMPATWEDAYGEQDFFVSTLINGLNPSWYNVASMNGNATELWDNGVLYRLVECDNVEIFADRGLYLCVCDGSFYNQSAYQYDTETGKITRNEDYSGMNALFELPVDEAKADPEKAAEYLAYLGMEGPDIDMNKLILDIDSSSLEIHGENEQGTAVAQYALQFVGNPYAWGGSSLTEGTDCSGLVMSVYVQFGIELPHSSSAQRQMGNEVDGLENAQPGDLFFYTDIRHVAIYLGDGMIIHSDPGIGICVSEADFAELSEIRRIFE